MNEKNSRKESQQELVERAWMEAENKDLLTVKTRKGDNFPLLSEWEAGGLVYRVIEVYSSGYITLARVMK